VHCRRPLQSPRMRYVREGHPEQRADTLRDRGRDERARQPRAQLSAALERRTQPGAPGDPAQPQDRRSIARSAPLGSHPILVRGPERRAQADQRQMRDCQDTVPSFREAYRKRRCILPVDGFFEWKAIKGQKAKQPYAIAMKDDSPFGIGGLWENWKDPTSGEWIRTFAIITTDANELVAAIHDRMPLILALTDYVRWLSDEPDPRDLMRPFPADPMRMWPISIRVNKPENDDPSIVEPIALATSAA
jgi:putative SOS response-associated peptidase YedK